MTILRKIRLPLFAFGLFAFIASERYFYFESYHVYILGSALVLAILATVVPFIESMNARKNSAASEAKSWSLVGAWQLSALVAMGVFIAYQKTLPSSGIPESILQKALLALWVMLFIIGGFTGVGIELAHANTGTGATAEPKRVGRSGLSWMMVGIILSTLICFNYVGAHKDKIYDWTYLKTTTPSESTLAQFKAISDKLEIHIFYPHDNDVKPFVASYFDYLASNGSNVKVLYHDKDLEPTVAEDLKVSRNGQIIFKAGDKRERVDVGLDLPAARNTLRKLDSEVQKQVLRLTSEKKKIYFTKGHGELSWIGGKEDQMRSISLVETLLRSQNYTVETLGLAEGSATDIPSDADAVIIVANEQPFVQQEADALGRYLDRGGRLAVFLDPAKSAKETPNVTEGVKDPLTALLASAGITFQKKFLANDRNHIQATRSPADHWFLFSNSFSSHDSVTNLSRNDERAAMFMFQVGYFDLLPQSGDWKTTTTVRTVAETFVDENRNSKFDEGKEKRQTYSIGVVATKPVKTKDKDGKDLETDARIVAFGDATALSDALIRNRANALFVLDSIKWLAGQADIMGAAASEEDVKIQHTNKEDAIWFNASVVFVPVFVLILGFFATRKRKSRGEQ